MPDMALVKFVTDVGAWGLSLLCLGLIWLRNRDDKEINRRVTKLEDDLEAIGKFWSSQDTANRLSAQADQAILQELARFGQRLEAVSTRVDSLSDTTVELRSDVRHLSEYRRERSP